MIVVSENQKPPDDALWGGMYAPNWERSSDPWHRDAFPAQFKNAAPEQGEPRKKGWMLYDWCGNPLGFVPDGTEFEE